MKGKILVWTNRIAGVWVIILASILIKLGEYPYIGIIGLSYALFHLVNMEIYLSLKNGNKIDVRFPVGFGYYFYAVSSEDDKKHFLNIGFFRIKM